MRSRVGHVHIALVGALLLTGVSADPAGASHGTGAAPTPQVTHVEVGTDTVATALALSRHAFPGDGAADEVVLARADLFPDALAGGALAAGRPILLTAADRLDGRVADELTRLGAQRAFVLGGPSAVMPAVTDELEQMGIEVERLAGADRIGTAIAIAERAAGEPPGGAVLIARAFGGPDDPTRAFADSIAAGAWAAASGRAILLTETERLSEATRAALERGGYDSAILVGGEAALSPAVANDIDALGIGVQRVAGPTRYETAAAIARIRAGASTLAGVVMVDGSAPTAWAAGLTAATISAAGSAPVILSEASAVPKGTADVLTSTVAGSPSTAASVVCAAPSGACDSVRALMQTAPITCSTTFQQAGRTGCQTTVNGLNAKYFVPPDGHVERIMLFFHGDGGSEWTDNWGFDATILDFAAAHDALVVGFLAPSSYQDGTPAYGAGQRPEALAVASGIDAFIRHYAPSSRQVLVWSVSGGSWFLNASFLSVVGHRFPGFYVPSCGGSQFRWDWEWQPHTEVPTRDLFGFHFNYGDQDFLAPYAADNHREFVELGFASEETVHAGAQHCAHPIEEPTIAFWSARLGV